MSWSIPYLIGGEKLRYVLFREKRVEAYTFLSIKESGSLSRRKEIQTNSDWAELKIGDLVFVGHDYSWGKLESIKHRDYHTPLASVRVLFRADGVSSSWYSECDISWLSKITPQLIEKLVGEYRSQLEGIRERLLKKEE